MANWRASFVAGAVGVSAGLSAYTPSFMCTGGACTSCFACVGAGGAAASALLVGFVSRKISARARRTDRCMHASDTDSGGIETRRKEKRGA